MLVLSRKKDESVVIEVNGVKIYVRVNDVRGDRVKLGFTAPKEVLILRQEVTVK